MNTCEPLVVGALPPLVLGNRAGARHVRVERHAAGILCRVVGRRRGIRYPGRVVLLAKPLNPKP